MVQKERAFPQNQANVRRGVIRIDVGPVPAPDYSIVANQCAILDHGSVFEFGFIQALGPRSEPKLAASVVVHIDAVVARLWSTSQRYLESEQKIFAGSTLRSELSKSFPPHGDAMIVGANSFRIARSGLEAVIDCLYISPTEIAAQGQGRGGRVQIDPVLRIELPGSVVLAMLEYVASKADELKKRLGHFAENVEPIA